MTDQGGAIDGPETTGQDGRGWRRAAALLVVVVLTSVAQPGVLIAIPLMVLFFVGGLRGTAATVAAVLATMVVVGGVRDGFWFLERGWALMAGGVFAAASLVVPRWGLVSRALVSVTASVGSVAAFVAWNGSWGALDWAVSDRLRGGFATWLDAMTVLRDGQAPSAALASAIYQTVEAQVQVFPALLALETMAALAVAWWLFQRLARGSDGALAPFATFRFNDHLVWLMITGLVLVGARVGDPATRLGANLAVFMGALYAVRGLAVGYAVGGGLSFFGFFILALGLLVAAPAVLGFAVLIGVADTWLDLRQRVPSPSA